jgi:hypothetical protein
MFNGEIHYKWPFSIAMLNNQRVCVLASQFLNSPELLWDLCGILDGFGQDLTAELLIVTNVM